MDGPNSTVIAWEVKLQEDSGDWQCIELTSHSWTHAESIVKQDWIIHCGAAKH
jgi:hypothetical protein